MRVAEPHSTQKSRPEVRIRLASREDLSFVRKLAVEVFSVYGSYGRYVTEWFDMDEVQTWIAELGGEAAGLMMLVARPHPWRAKEAVADLLAIAVASRHQHKGLGTELLQKAMEETERLPSPFPILEIHLSVAEGNARAQRLFQRRGFRLISGEGVYPAGQRALHMVKVLEKRRHS